VKPRVAGLHAGGEAPGSVAWQITGMAARHEFIPHVAEMALRLTADTVAELYAEACAALGSLLAEEAGQESPAEERVLTLASADAEALLVDLLNELIYLAETARWAPEAAQVEHWEAGRLTVRVTGVRLRETPARIKSATHHGLHLTVTEHAAVAEVILDV
jgi:SHS2 domain-containing protein